MKKQFVDSIFVKTCDDQVRIFAFWSIMSHDVFKFYTIFLADARASPMMTILLGTVSVFLPNGYLLYNFAATFLCDFTFDQSKKYLFFHMLAVTTEFCICVGIIWIGQVQEWSFIVENIPSNSVLQG